MTEKIVNVLCLIQLVFLTTTFFQGKDTCRFDGGGPLVCNDLLTGVVGTFGASCAAKDTPRQSGYIKWQKSFFLLYNTLRPESSENIPILLQEADLCFSKQNCPMNPKMGSKQSVVVATH